MDALDERSPAGGASIEAAPAGLTLDDRWAGRLTAFALAAIAAVILEVAGAGAAALSVDDEFRRAGGRWRYWAQAASPTTAVLLLVAAVSMVVAGRIRSTTRVDLATKRAILLGAVVVAALAIVGWIDSLGGRLSPNGWLDRASASSRWIEVLVLTTIAALLTNAIRLPVRTGAPLDG